MLDSAQDYNFMSSFRRAAGKMNSQQKLGLVRRKRWLQSSCNLRWCTHLVTVTNFSESRNLQKLQFQLNVQVKNAHLSPVSFFSKNKPVWRISNTGKIVFACILPLDCLFCEGEIESCQTRHWPSASWIFPIFKNCAAYSARFELNMRQRTGKNAIICLLLSP